MVLALGIIIIQNNIPNFAKSAVAAVVGETNLFLLICCIISPLILKPIPATNMATNLGTLLTSNICILSILNVNISFIEISSRNPLATLNKIDISDIKNIPCILISSKEQLESDKEYYQRVMGFGGEFIFAENLEEGRLFVAGNKGFMPVEDITFTTRKDIPIKRIALCRDEKQIKKDLVVSKYKENFIKDIKISDKEIKAHYESHKDEFKIQEVRASQILISTLDDDNKQVSKEEKEKLKTKAEKLLNKVNNGEDFNKLAKKYSDDKNSGKNGGDLGFFSKDDKNIDFTKEVFKLDKGKRVALIETSYGYHIVKITDKRTVTKSLEDSKDDIKNKILNEKYSKQIDSLYKKGKITIT